MVTSNGALDRSMVRAVAWNAAAKWGSQVLSWVSTVVVARLLTPYDFGLVGMVGLFTALAMLINQVGVGDAVITLRDLTRHQIAQLNTVSVLIGVGLVVMSWGLALPMAHFFSAPPLRAVVTAVGMTYAINAFQVVPRAVLQKELRFKLLASIETVRVICQIVATIALAWLGFHYWSLVWGYIVGSFASTGLTCIFRWHGFASPRIGQLGRELRFSGHILLSEIGGYVYDNADFFVAGRVLGGVPLGNYTVAWTISSAPIEKIGAVVTGVSPAFFSAVQDDKAKLRRYFLGITETLSLVTVPASIGLALTADLLIPALLGSKWLGVIGPLRLLGLFVAVRSVTTLMGRILIAVSDTGFVMWVAVGADLLLPMAFFIGSRWGTSGIAGAWVVAYPFVVAPMLHRILKRLDTGLREYVSSVIPALAASCIMAVAVLLIRAIIPDGWPLLVRFSVLLTVGMLSYGGALFACFRPRLTRMVGVFRNIRDQRLNTVEAAIEATSRTEPSDRGLYH